LTGKLHKIALFLEQKKQ